MARGDGDKLPAFKLVGNRAREDRTSYTENPRVGLPVDASRAKKLPSGLPLKTSPPAVESTPAHGGECSGNSHFSSPVNGSSALMDPCGSAAWNAAYTATGEMGARLVFDS